MVLWCHWKLRVLVLHKLWSCGVSGNLGHWFSISYGPVVSLETYGIGLKPTFHPGLSQQVFLNGELSMTRSVISGVPHGILGPLLFLIFINDIPSCISTSSVLLYVMIQNVLIQ